MEANQKFLHGTLEVTIFDATPYTPPFPFNCLYVNGKPTYVTIKIDQRKVAKTSPERDRVWNQTLQILCAHHLDSTITITLKTKCSILGKFQIQAHKINASFPQRSNCHVTLYQDAHHCSSFQPPLALCGSPRKLLEDVCKAIEGAKHLIYIAGWSFNPKMVLVRDPETEIQEARGVKLGELLKRKAEEGVAVRIMIWNDETSLPVIKNKGVMGTHDEDAFAQILLELACTREGQESRGMILMLALLVRLLGMYLPILSKGGVNNVTLVCYPTSSIANLTHQLTVSSSVSNDRNWKVQVFRSIDHVSATQMARNLTVERSIHEAYVEAIRLAERFIYIENQYFIGGCHLWDKDRHCGCSNLIPIEIALKIVHKIKAKERFAVYVLIPMWPEGVPESEPVQDILHWTRETMAMMYRLIGEALQESDQMGHPRDFLNFFCLANREEERKGEFVPPYSPHPSTQYWNAQKHRRFMVYVHSKLMIVDDAYILIGSANVNQRSMDGQRDTEIAIGCYQPENDGNKTSPSDIQAYRMSLWYEHTSLAEEIFLEPQSLECVQKTYSLGEAMWKIYSGEEVVDMEGVHLVNYPVNVTMEGIVEDLVDGNGNFPDTKTPVKGRSSKFVAVDYFEIFVTFYWGDVAVSVNEVEALLDLFKKLSSSIVDDGLLHKEELQLALLRTASSKNLFLDRKKGAIEFEDFVHSLNVFHPRASLEDKIDFAFRLYDLKETGYIGREEVRQMLNAIFLESDLQLSEQYLEAIIDKTLADADADKDGQINKEEWKAFVVQNPTLLKHMTLPYLMDITTAFPSFIFNTEVDD
ncbi:hypothetical protein GH714_036034 [Hevea brasiliensis]|uniref:phospholipase D n=1 Tax=Hevea brasiliensis TaxID=3981 RepID=A0A6A6NEI2_HEVBR|nr:hypothetical protein GH714_036034 [Hevea brasiliensis]